MGPIGCPETSVQNYHSTLRNIPGGHRSQPLLLLLPQQICDYTRCAFTMHTHTRNIDFKDQCCWIQSFRLRLLSTGTALNIPSFEPTIKNLPQDNAGNIFIPWNTDRKSACTETCSESHSRYNCSVNSKTKVKSPHTSQRHIREWRYSSTHS
jgi:hypothetical protein